MNLAVRGSSEADFIPPGFTLLAKRNPHRDIESSDEKLRDASGRVLIGPHVGEHPHLLPSSLHLSGQTDCPAKLLDGQCGDLVDLVWLLHSGQLFGEHTDMPHVVASLGHRVREKGGFQKDEQSVLLLYHLLRQRDRKSTRLNSSHGSTSYAVFCLKKKTRLLPGVRGIGAADYSKQMTKASNK